MKTISVAIAPVIALLLALPGGYSPDDLAIIFKNPSGITDRDQAALIQIQENLTQTTRTLSTSILGVDGLLSTISYSAPGNTAAAVSPSQSDSWILQMELILQQSCQGFIHAINLNNYLPSTVAKSKQKTATVQMPIQPKVVFSTMAIGSAIAGSMYYLFSETKKNIDEAQYIVYETAMKSEYHRQQAINILRKTGIYVHQDAPANQIWESFKASSYKKRRHASADLRDWVASNQAITYNSDLAQNDQNRIVSLTAKQGKVAVKVVVDSSLTVLNTGWSSLIPGEIPGAVVDITTTYYGAGPSDLFEKTLNMAAVSGNQDELTLPIPTMTTDDAKQILAELQDRGTDGISGQALDMALSTFGSSLARFDTATNSYTLTYPEYTMFQSIQLTTDNTTPSNMTGTLKIPEKYMAYFFDFLYTGSDVLEWFKSYHTKLNQEIGIPQNTVGEDDQECLHWQDGVCVVPLLSGNEQPGSCNQTDNDISLTNHTGTAFCLSHLLAADDGQPKICSRTLTTPDDIPQVNLFNAPYYTISQDTLTDTISARCTYMRPEVECNTSADVPDILTLESITTPSGTTKSSWIIYEEQSCNAYYAWNKSMHDNTFNPLFDFSWDKRHGLQIEYHGYFPESLTAPSPCHDQPRDIFHYQNDVFHGSQASFICDEQSGQNYLSQRTDFADGQYHGLMQNYYPDTHTLETESWWEHGLQHGTTRVYSKTGILVYLSEHSYGKLQGEEWFFYDDGAQKELISWLNSTNNGPWKKWDQDGTLTECALYTAGTYVESCL